MIKQLLKTHIKKLIITSLIMSNYNYEVDKNMNAIFQTIVCIQKYKYNVKYVIIIKRKEVVNNKTT